MQKAEESHAVARLARWSHRMVASPYAPLVALVLIALALFVLPPLGLDEARVRPVEFVIALVTLLLIFLLEHNEERDTTAIHVKLDEILLALGADERKVGVEDLPAQKIEEVRAEERRRAGVR